MRQARKTCSAVTSDRSKRPVAFRRYGGRNQAGIVLAPILAAVALLVALGTFVVQTTQTSAVQSYLAGTVPQMLSQGKLIRSRIVRCVIAYPNGNNGVGGKAPFPGGDDVLVVDLTCPGAPVGARDLWDGRNATFFPKPPPRFDEWRYINDASGVRISIKATGDGDSATAAVLDQVAGKYRSDEASVTSGVLTLWVTK